MMSQLRSGETETHTMYDTITLGGIFLLGAVVGASGSVLVTRRASRSEVETTNENIALSILAGQAIAQMTPEERRDVKERVNERMEAAFGEGAGIEIDEVIER